MVGDEAWRDRRSLPFQRVCAFAQAHDMRVGIVTGKSEVVGRPAENSWRRPMVSLNAYNGTRLVTSVAIKQPDSPDHLDQASAALLGVLMDR